MLVGTLRVELLISDAFSLKEKRFILKSIKDKLRHRFNCSVAEIDYQDKWQHSVLGVALVSNDRRFIDTMIQKILKTIIDDHRMEVIDQLIEIL